jgi:LURP-one-related
MAAIPTLTPPPPAPAPKITGLEMPMEVLGAQFCVPYDVELVVTEKAIALDDASAAVKDANGNVVLKLKGRLLGIHEKRWLCDANGATIVTMQQKVLPLI